MVFRFFLETSSFVKLSFLVIGPEFAFSFVYISSMELNNDLH